MCSVVTNLVTSLRFDPIRCASTLDHIGRTWNGYVATRFVLLSGTSESSAASGYNVVSERFGRKAEAARRNEKRTKKKPSSVPGRGFNRCNL